MERGTLPRWHGPEGMPAQRTSCLRLVHQLPLTGTAQCGTLCAFVALRAGRYLSVCVSAFLPLQTWSSPMPWSGLA